MEVGPRVFQHFPSVAGDINSRLNILFRPSTFLAQPSAVVGSISCEIAMPALNTAPTKASCCPGDKGVPCLDMGGLSPFSKIGNVPAHHQPGITPQQLNYNKTIHGRQ